MFSRPLHPLLVLVVAILLPGMGQVLNGMLVRAWIMIFFTLSLGVVTYHLTTPPSSVDTPAVSSSTRSW